MICTEWMRPGGSVSLLVDSRPKPTRTPSGVAAIEYRSDFTTRFTRYEPKPNSDRDDREEHAAAGVGRRMTTTSPTIAMTKKIIVVLSSVEPISRPGCIVTTDSGGARFGSSSGAVNSATRWRATSPSPRAPQQLRRIRVARIRDRRGVRLAGAVPDARRRISARSSSALAPVR